MIEWYKRQREEFIFGLKCAYHEVLSEVQPPSKLFKMEFAPDAYHSAKAAYQFGTNGLGEVEKAIYRYATWTTLKLMATAVGIVDLDAFDLELYEQKRTGRG